MKKSHYAQSPAEGGKAVAIDKNLTLYGKQLKASVHQIARLTDVMQR